MKDEGVLRDAAASKRLIRASEMARLQKLPQYEVLERSQRIIRNLKCVPEFLGASDVLLCLSFGNEPNTWGLMQELIRSRGKKLYLPRSDASNPSSLSDFTIAGNVNDVRCVLSA